MMRLNEVPAPAPGLLGLEISHPPPPSPRAGASFSSVPV